jgi:hypothetical protein
MFSGKCSCHIRFIFVLVVAYIVGSFVDCKSICMCRTQYFAFQNGLQLLVLLYPFECPVSCDDAVETVTQKGCKVQHHTSCSVGSEHNVVLVIQFSLHEPSTVFFVSVIHSGEET